MPQVLKRQAVGSPKAKDVNTGDPDYAPIPLSESALAKNGPFYPGGKNGVIGVHKVLQMG